MFGCGGWLVGIGGEGCGRILDVSSGRPSRAFQKWPGAEPGATSAVSGVGARAVEGRSDMQAVVVMSKHATAASLAAGRFVCVARGTGSMASMRGRDAQSLHTSARIRAY
jgi:hypothetical protein